MPVVHDWGGLIGMRWACEHPEAVEALAISSTGFFPDGKWHGMAQALRKQHTGEQMIGRRSTRDTFASVMRQSMASAQRRGARSSTGRPYADATRRTGHLELYRSGDFSKLEQYDLATLDVPVLLVWGEQDEYAPVAGAHRSRARAAGTRSSLL